jgi:hypothetical protein
MALLERKEQMEMSCGAIPNVFPRAEHVWRKCRVSSVVVIDVGGVLKT